MPHTRRALRTRPTSPGYSAACSAWRRPRSCARMRSCHLPGDPCPAPHGTSRRAGHGAHAGSHVALGGGFEVAGRKAEVCLVAGASDAALRTPHEHLAVSRRECSVPQTTKEVARVDTEGAGLVPPPAPPTWVGRASRSHAHSVRKSSAPSDQLPVGSGPWPCRSPDIPPETKARRCRSPRAPGRARAGNADLAELFLERQVEVEVVAFRFANLVGKSREVRVREAGSPWMETVSTSSRR